ELFWSPALGARLEIAAGLFLRANGGRYLRAPDLAELYGDRGAVVGNPDLVPEVGWNADAGATWIRQGSSAGLTLLRLDAAWFGSWAEDLIAYVQNSQRTIRPENVDAARILGVETMLRLVLFDLVSLQGNYTYLNTINRSEKPYHDGRRLPGRPEHEAYARLGVERVFERWGGAVWIDADYAGNVYLDQANLKDDAVGRLLFGLGYRLERPREGLALTLEVKNIFDTISVEDARGNDRPVRDYEAYPLPGRTFLATIHYRL
ncbi:MAG TPA: TonB-dependent receptor, partial [Polyangia bacterium]|nr:TonB-dependent receptor [Polyangia bacterium]